MMNKTAFTPMETSRLFHDKEIINRAAQVENSNYDNLTEGLLRIARTRHLEEDVAADAAKKILDTVIAYEATAQQVSEDPTAAMEETFDKMAALDPAQRLELMNQMYFSLSLCTDEALGAQLKDGASYEDLYHTFRVQNTLNEEALRSMILDQVTGGSLTPDALDLLSASAASVTGDASFTQSVIGYQGCKYKALAAMHLYANSLKTEQPLTPEAAALKACATADIQGLADSFTAGNIAKWVVLTLMFALILRTMIRAVELLVAAVTLKEFLLVIVVGYLMMEGIYVLGDDLSQWIAPAVAAAVPMVKNGIRQFRDAMSSLRAEAAEKRAENTAAAQEDDISTLSGLPLTEEELDYRPLTSYI